MSTVLVHLGVCLTPYPRKRLHCNQWLGGVLAAELEHEVIILREKSYQLEVEVASMTTELHRLKANLASASEMIEGAFLRRADSEVPEVLAFATGLGRMVGVTRLTLDSCRSYKRTQPAF